MLLLYFMRLAFLAILLLSLSTFAATYKGQNIDGKKYAAMVDNGKIIVSSGVIFSGKSVYLTKLEVTGKLLSEEIIDQHDIEITVGNEAWTIDIVEEIVAPLE